jgi:hypothetical protein
MRRNFQRVIFQIAVLLICLEVFLSTGCNSRNGPASGTDASPFPAGKFWGHRGGAILDNTNFYQAIKSSPEYGVVNFHTPDADDSNNHKFNAIASLKLCRNEYMQEYRKGTLIDCTHNFVPLKLKYIVLVLFKTKPKANLNSMSDDETLKDFCDSFKIGYVFPADDVFSESVNYDELIAKAYVDEHPVTTVEKPKKNYVYKIIDNHKQAIDKKQAQSGEVEK